MSSSESLPPALVQAAAEFNAGLYFACHETLEAFWLADVSPERDLYKAVIQVAAGLYHLENGNMRGCRKLLTRATGYLERFTPQAAGIDVAGLVAMARAILAWLETGSPGEALPPSLVPRLTLTAV